MELAEAAVAAAKPIKLVDRALVVAVTPATTRLAGLQITGQAAAVVVVAASLPELAAPES